jgi:hypothetical protein
LEKKGQIGSRKLLHLLTNINIASSVHKYHSAFPPIGHPTDKKNYQEQGCAPVLHSYPLSEMAENIMFDSMPGSD